MIQDFSTDVKQFLLTYTSIDQLERLAKGELKRTYALLEAELAKQAWFSSSEFQTNVGWQWVQLWKKHWQPSSTQKCPWIHFEYTLSWANKWVQASVDIESQRIASRDAIQSVADQLRQLLSEEKPNLIEGKGWMIRPTLEENRMILVNRRTIDDAKFSAEWIFNTGKGLFDELSEVIPIVDNTVNHLFG